VPGKLTVCPTRSGTWRTSRCERGARFYEADVIACEDTRRTGLLLERLEIQALRLVSYHEGNEGRASARARPADRAGGTTWRSSRMPGRPRSPTRASA